MSSQLPFPDDGRSPGQRDSTATLEHAEAWLRHCAAQAEHRPWSDTDRCMRLIVDELDRLRAAGPTQAALDDLAWRLETAVDGHWSGLTDVRTVAARLRLGWADGGVIDAEVVDDEITDPDTTGA